MSFLNHSISKSTPKQYNTNCFNKLILLKYIHLFFHQKQYIFFFLDYQPICFYVDGDNVGEIEEDAFAFPKMTDQQIAANLAESGIVDQPAAATVSSTPEVKK